jgi:hypothetical protein
MDLDLDIDHGELAAVPCTTHRPLDHGVAGRAELAKPSPA